MNSLKFYIVGLILMAFSSVLKADREMPPLRPLSDDAYITLLTCDPGAPLYATFGHSALCITDPHQGIDWVFNYGTFNFNTPNFYLKFASGKLLYKLGYGSKKRFLREYQYEQRLVIEDHLNLTKYQKQKLFNYLLENYKPENREYQYDFFFDNCATRVLDILYESLGDSLQFIPAENPEIRTYRNLIDEYLCLSNWSDFGIDIALGSVIDKPASDRGKAFLPDYLKEYLDNCIINGKPLLYDTKLAVSNSAPLPKTPFLVSPQLWIWILFAFIAFLSIIWRNKAWVIADRIIFSTFGLVGIIVLLLWFATDHDATAGNLNILWANPLYILYAWLIGGKREKLLKWASFGVLMSNILVLLAWTLIPQQYHTLFIPIILALIIRSIVLTTRYWNVK
ncbi:MAG: DUF4105 domain-containing protein [Salinivirgaceae bacterium]|nr:DUF4105 domain-containing protein [Salinivirgaceae bacterium]